jgi:hypothetical protein
MTEILTESFCERCGTRYTFESARPKTRLKSVKVLSRGLKNFVLSDDTSIDEAMAAARSETDREVTAHQLDAFHKTFNFCMSCRQYTCPNCWNEPETRCLSCAPLALPAEPVRLEDLAAFGDGGRIGDTGLIGEVDAGNGAPAHEHRGWPEAIEATAETPEAPIAADAALVTEPGAEEAFIEPAPIEPASLEPVSEQLAVSDVAEAASVEADAAQKAAAQTSGLLRRFRLGQNLDAELDAYERERSQAGGGGAAAEATVAESASAEPGVEPIETSPATVEAEPVAEVASAEAPAAAEAGQPTTEPEPEPLAAASTADVVEQPTWRITAPDASGAAPLPPTAEPGAPVPVQATAAEPADATGEPQWPARSQWPGASPTAGLPFLGRPAAGQGGIEALWAASNQELVTAPPPPGRVATSSIQPCVSCGLSLSATARFCRRCGTLQAR